MRALVEAVHRAGKRVLLVVGGDGAAPGFRIASSPKHLANTLRSILSLVDRYGYDGIDVDWEPLASEDTRRYSLFIESLRKGLDRMPSGEQQTNRCLTTAIEVDLNDTEYMVSLLRTLRKLDEKLDRINVMTYTMAIPSSLPFVWHNSALYPGASPKDGFRTPSADGAIREFLAAGFQPERLGIGINLYGYLWQGKGPEDVSTPGRIWKSRPKVKELTYGEVATLLRNHSTYWDEQAKVPYMSIPLSKQFISYEDRRGIDAKVRYVQQKDLGGLIVWDIGRDDRDENAKRELLGAINNAVNLDTVPGTGETILP
jgi:chitinase